MLSLNLVLASLLPKKERKKPHPRRSLFPQPFLPYGTAILPAQRKMPHPVISVFLFRTLCYVPFPFFLFCPCFPFPDSSYFSLFIRVLSPCFIKSQMVFICFPRQLSAFRKNCYSVTIFSVFCTLYPVLTHCLFTSPHPLLFSSSLRSPPPKKHISCYRNDSAAPLPCPRRPAPAVLFCQG